MFHLTFHGGAGEIGGNKILLEYGGARTYLDFGQSFDFGKDYFLDWLKPGAANGLECYFEFGLLPKIPRLYSEKALEFTDLPYAEPDIDAVFISHHHSDHVGTLEFLDESIPIHMGHGTKAVLDAYSTLYPGLVDIGDHVALQTFKSGDRIKVKNLTFWPIHVEHSAPGAYGYIIEGPEGTIVYTGDFRRHGPMKAFTEEFIAEAAKAKPRVLLCEGTRMTPDPENHDTEEEVHDKILEIMKKARGLVLAEFSMCNIDRFNSFYRAAQETGRTMVVDTKYAYLLDRLNEIIPSVPDPRTNAGLKVYFKLAKTREFAETDYKKFEREYLDNRITFEEIRKNQKKFVMVTGFNKLMELVYIHPDEANYIYSQSEHYLEGEDNKDQHQVLENWLQHFGIHFHKAHCSGHAGRSDLEYTVSQIKPKTLIPIHTDHPEEFKKIHDDVRIVKKGETVTF
ncbi:MAG: MBL fold metallo-hydrolase [Candidatus Aminicenantes bacterium]|nr:MBL fold metallo-hydrolase [Candidatus Aminicenantes bacterium]